MNEYKIYFEIYGKKMQVTISAENENEAKFILFSKITFHKIELVEYPDVKRNVGDVPDILKQMFGM